MFVLFERSDGSPMVIAGPCWPFCMGVTLPLILGISALVCYFVLFNSANGLVSSEGGLRTCTFISFVLTLLLVAFYNNSLSGLHIFIFLSSL